MRQITASQFKEQCLYLLDHLGSEGLIVTKRGKPLAKVIPMSSECADLIGSMKGKLKIKGDILSAVHNVPLLTRDRQIRKSKLVRFA